MNEATDAEPGARTCEKTGLRLWPARGQHAYRVATTSYGAMNPIVRPGEWPDGDVLDWGRWDTAPGRTIYVSASKYGAYLGVLSHIAPSSGLSATPMAQTFPEDSAGDPRSVMDQIRAEWHTQHGGWSPEKVGAGWRLSRALYTLQLPADGWFIDIAHSDSIAALRRVDGALGGPLASTRVDLSHLTGPVRPWTVSLATELRRIVLDDGSLAHGIKYPSTHGIEHECFAYWMRAVDDGKQITSEATREIERIAIRPTQRNATFHKAASQLGLTCY